MSWRSYECNPDFDPGDRTERLLERQGQEAAEAAALAEYQAIEQRLNMHWPIVLRLLCGAWGWIFFDNENLDPGGREF